MPRINTDCVWRFWLSLRSVFSST